ncbi:hypothetical protein AB0J14_34760 [Micromonospora arborensis]|uniref:hypothetical protein n=1 Tax=Micromonospora arborensis TaxID=2116518 RepID=UPI003406DFCA
MSPPQPTTRRHAHPAQSLAGLGAVDLLIAALAGGTAASGDRRHQERAPRRTPWAHPMLLPGTGACLIDDQLIVR